MHHAIVLALHHSGPCCRHSLRTDQHVGLNIVPDSDTRPEAIDRASNTEPELLSERSRQVASEEGAGDSAPGPSTTPPANVPQVAWLDSETVGTGYREDDHVGADGMTSRSFGHMPCLGNQEHVLSVDTMTPANNVLRAHALTSSTRNATRISDTYTDRWGSLLGISGSHASPNHAQTEPSQSVSHASRQSQVCRQD